MSEPIPTEFDQNSQGVVAAIEQAVSDVIQGNASASTFAGILKKRVQCADNPPAPDKLTSIALNMLDDTSTSLAGVNDHEPARDTKYSSLCLAIISEAVRHPDMDAINLSAISQSLLDAPDVVKTALSALPIRLLNDGVPFEVVDEHFVHLNPSGFLRHLSTTGVDGLVEYQQFLIARGLLAKEALNDAQIKHNLGLVATAKAHREEQERRKAETEAHHRIRKTIDRNPDAGYRQILEEVEQQGNGLPKDAAILAAKYYLTNYAYTAAGMRPDVIWDMIDDARDKLRPLLGKGKEIHYLASAILPTRNDLDAFLEEYPELKGDSVFIDNWVARLVRLRKRNQIDSETRIIKDTDLSTYGLDRVEVELPAKLPGIPYGSDAEKMLQDIYEYFIVYRNSRIYADVFREDVPGIDFGQVGRVSDPESKLQEYQSYIVNYFQDFVSKVKTPKSSDKPTRETLTITSFSQHTVTITIEKNSDGGLVFYLNTYRGGYSSNGHRASEEFAAFVDRSVTYPQKPKLWVYARPALPDGFMYKNNEFYDTECRDNSKAEELLQQIGNPKPSHTTVKELDSYGTDEHRYMTTSVWNVTDLFSDQPNQLKSLIANTIGKPVESIKTDEEDHHYEISLVRERLSSGDNPDTAKIIRDTFTLVIEGVPFRKISAGKLTSEQVEMLMALNRV